MSAAASGHGADVQGAYAKDAHVRGAFAQGADAEGWAANILPASRALPYPPSGEAHGGGEPSDADRALASRSGDIRWPTQQGPMVQADAPVAAGTAPHRLGVVDLLAAYRSFALSPTDVLADLLGRADAAPAVLRRIDGAGLLAEESARRWRDGNARPLEGIPFGVKDIIDVAGTLVTCGSLLTGDRMATGDAAVVARLRDAGAIPFVMLASSEFACGSAHNRRFGVVPNPYDATRWTGGSSTGSAAALAGRLLPLALGTDTGGSIRIPSAFCGVTGLKPTRELLPRHGVATLSWTLDHVGPMARSAADIAAVLPVMAGLPEGTRREPQAALRGLRIGVPDGWFTERCDGVILRAWRSALSLLEAEGAVLRPVRVPDCALAIEEAWMILYAELASCQEGRLDHLDAFDAGARDRIERGRAMTASDYLRALRRRALVQARWLDILSEIDVLLTPGAGSEAPALKDVSVCLDGERVPYAEIASRNSMIFNLTGFPALMLPCGRGPSGLPLGMQIVAAPFRDALCLAVGQAFQSLTSFHGMSPG